MTRKRKKEYTDYDLISKDIIRNFPIETIELFFGNKLGTFDFSHSVVLSENVNSIDKRSGEKRFPDIVQTAKITKPGSVLKIKGKVILLWEPHSYNWNTKTNGRTFAERMHEYVTDVSYHHGTDVTTNQRMIVVPLALFYGKAQKSIKTVLSIPGLLEFNFFKANIHDLDWKTFKGSDNPVAASYLALMKHDDNELVDMKIEAYKILSRNSSVVADIRKRELVINIIETLFDLDEKEKGRFIETYNELLKEDKEMALLKSPIESETYKKLIFETFNTVLGIRMEPEIEEKINSVYDEAFLMKVNIEMSRLLFEIKDAVQIQKSIINMIKNRN